MDIRDNWVDGKQNAGQIAGDTPKVVEMTKISTPKPKIFPGPGPNFQNFTPGMDLGRWWIIIHDLIESTLDIIQVGLV